MEAKPQLPPQDPAERRSGTLLVDAESSRKDLGGSLSVLTGALTLNRMLPFLINWVYFYYLERKEKLFIQLQDSKYTQTLELAA